MADKIDYEGFIANAKQHQTNRDHVRRMLDQLVKEFPHYHIDKGQMADAGLVLGAMVGSIGAWVMAHSSDPEASLAKFLRMVTAAAMDTAHKGYPMIKDRVKK